MAANESPTAAVDQPPNVMKTLLDSMNSMLAMVTTAKTELMTEITGLKTNFEDMRTELSDSRQRLCALETTVMKAQSRCVMQRALHERVPCRDSLPHK